MKARAESETAPPGLTDRELKRGRGGIRDIEFAVQLLQLVHGRHDPTVRCPNTLDALAQLAAGGLRRPTDDAAPLADAYRFLRTVEHRLQLYDEQQTHTLPTDERRAHPARPRARLPRPRRRDRGSSASTPTTAAHQAAVRSIHERLFFAPAARAARRRRARSTAEAAEERLARSASPTRARPAPRSRELTRRLHPHARS